MREYAKLEPRFWIGDTGQKLRAAGRDAQLLALYLVTCPFSNMIGLYYLPMALICAETGMDTEGASKALRRVMDAGFANYDDASQTVFVPEMAKFQIGDRLDPKDNRVKAVAKEVAQYHKSIFFQQFMERYGSAFAISAVVDDMLRSKAPSQAPSKPLRSQEQEQEQEKEKDQEHKPHQPKPAKQRTSNSGGTGGKQSPKLDAEVDRKPGGNSMRGVGVGGLGGGSVAGRGVGLHPASTANGDDFARARAVQAVLAEAEVAAINQPEFYNRRDLTAKIVSRELVRIRKCNDVADVAGALVGRLRKIMPGKTASNKATSTKMPAADRTESAA
jgi:hypothetical protein